ncbi:hypothetical protein TELCIR_02252 [Teladorsagia circumcincta]|uniref:Late embryogeneis abundant protein n=1 Tax=Teladorsagia circumcincta TaxID=45464 RepID=A0A2G9UZN6_TELCI|nr:hypothetical protein TELCIR_02252 [Teladorsagia circumcincta]
MVVGNLWDALHFRFRVRIAAVLRCVLAFTAAGKANDQARPEEDVVRTMQNAGQSGVNWVENAAKDTGNFLSNAGREVGEQAKQASKDTGAFVSDAGRAAGDKAKQAWDAAGQKAGELGNSAREAGAQTVKAEAKEAGNAVEDKGVFTKIGDFFKGIGK